jgi:hypothetical protein
VPFGGQIGITAAPAGLAVWSLRSGSLSRIFQASPTAGERIKVYSLLKFEGFLWLAIAICGFLGAVLADKIFRRRPVELPDKIKPMFPLPWFLAIPISIIGSVFVANFLINILAIDVSYPDQKLGSITAQPANLQIAFAVLMSFAACGFLAKTVVGSKGFWSAIASAVVIYYSAISYGKSDVMVYLSSTWPANFYSKPVIAVLPIQLVSFGCLGAVWGYWLAVDYYLWRTQQG